MSDSPRTVFLDFDGTLAVHGVVPAPHVEAVRAARERGHRVLLCTGRPRCGVPEAALRIGWDGLVCSAGAYVEIDGRVLHDARFPAELAERTVRALDAHGVVFALEAPEANLVRAGELPRLLAGLQAAGFAPSFGPELGLTAAERVEGASFVKVTCFDAPVPVERIAREIGPELDSVPLSLPGCGHGGEIHLRGMHKAVGAALAVQALGTDPERVLAVGDSRNDLELLDYAALAVAIRGAEERLIDAADRIAPPPEEHGVAVLFAELGLSG